MSVAPLQQRDGNGQVAAVHGGAGALDEIVGLHVGGRNRRSGDRALDGELLREIGADGAAEGFIIRAAGCGDFVLAKREFASGSEDAVLEFVGRFVLGVVALQREGERSVCGVLGGQLEFDLVGIVALGTELQRLGIGVAIVIGIDFGQAELHERQDDVGFLLRPIEEIYLGDVVRQGERLARGGRIADFEIGDVAAKTGVHVFDDALPVGLRHAAEDGTQQQFFVAAKLVVHVGFELADIVNLAIDFGEFGVGHGSVRWNVLPDAALSRMAD